MMQDDTLWDAPPHTLVKHKLYKRYLQAWLPILVQGGYPHLAVIDGFAGPGKYVGGEPGSPVIAVRAILEHSRLSSLFRGRPLVNFLFIEQRRDRFQVLSEQLAPFSQRPEIVVKTVNGQFDEEWTKIVGELETGTVRPQPTLLLIDPFGPVGFPMASIARAAAYAGSELLINFAYQPINQWFLNDPRKHKRLDELFGDDRWRVVLKITDQAAKESTLVDLYQQALAERGWRGVAFRLINAHNQTQYYLIYGTQNNIGMRVFKDAAWFASGGAGLSFSDVTNPDQIGFLDVVHQQDVVRRLKQALFDEYGGKTVPMDDLMVYTDWDQTARIPDLRSALKELENETPTRIVDVILPDGKKRRKGDFAPDCIVTFSDVGQPPLL